MSHSVVWLDHRHAKIFEFSKTARESHELQRIEHFTDHHVDWEGKDDTKKFFKALADDLHKFREILLVGPGLGKEHFKKYLEDHDHELSKKVVGIEAMDHPTDNQLVACAKKYFKEHHILI